MPDWSYHVTISTEESSSISDAVKELETSQELAKIQFGEVIDFFKNDKFAEDILKTFGEQIEKFEKDQNEENFKKLIVPILNALQEVRAGVLLLMDIKQSDIVNVIDSFNKIMESMGSEGSMKTIFTDILKKEVTELQANKDQQIVEILKQLNLKTPTINKREGTFLSQDEESANLYTGDYSNNAIGDFAQINTGYSKFMANAILDEFGGIISGISSTSGKDIFEEVLGEGLENEAYINIYDLLAGIVNINKRINTLGLSTDDMTEVDDVYKAKAQGLQDLQAALITELVLPEHWTFLRNEFEKGFLKDIKSESLFSSEGGKMLLSDMLDKVFENLFEHIQKVAAIKVEHGEELITRNPGISRGVFSALKEITKSTTNILDNLSKYQLDNSPFGDPLNINILKKYLPDFLIKSSKDVKDTEDPLFNYKDALKKNLDYVSFDALISTTFSSYVETILKSGSSKARLELQEAFSNIDVDLSDENIDIKSLLGIIKTMKEFTRQSKGDEPITEDTVEDEIPPNFQKYFEDAIGQRETIMTAILQSEQAIVLTFKEIMAPIISKIDETLISVYGIKTYEPGEGLAGTPSDFYKAIGKS